VEAGGLVTRKLDAIQVLALSCFGLVLGGWLKRRFPVLDHLNIPAPIVGGLVYALTMLFLRGRVNFEMELSLQRVLMVAFFTSVGLGASVTLVRKGGPQVLLFLVIATIGAAFQNGLGVGLSRLFGLNPLLGIVSGSVALTGGPATALSFGKTFEALGVTGATTLGVSCAMFGMTAGGLLGGFIGGNIIRSRDLRSQTIGIERHAVLAPVADEVDVDTEEASLLQNIVVIGICMGLGSIIGAWFTSRQIVLPEYVGAMIVAAVVRNLDDRFRFVGISQRHADMIGNISLSIFIVMAMLGLRLWELANLALPMISMLLVQVALIWLMCLGVFRLMGKDYEAAIMSGGFCGFMLGTTANAVACMSVLTQKYGPAPRAFIVVPLVGASLIDFTNATIINAMTNFLR
jgi:ESS family glutamate:Na+ symporter